MTCEERYTNGVLFAPNLCGCWLCTPKMTIYGCHASGMYGMQARDQSRRIILLCVAREWRATNAKTIAAALILSTNIMRKNIVYNAFCIMLFI